MSVTMQPFGTAPGLGAVSAYRIENSGGMSVTVIDYGAAIQSICVKNSTGGFTDVALGYDTAEQYALSDGNLGATVGRFANRLGGAEFSLNGVTYKLAKNSGENCLHGGIKGFDKRMWNAECGENCVRFSRLSPDGEEGFPGNLQISVTYTLTENNALNIAYDCESDADTVINLTNHCYFNLRGSGSALDQKLMINAERITELGEGTLPNGRFMSVAGTPFDFRTLKPIGQDINADDEQLVLGGGYDHNFVLSGPHAATAVCEDTGIRMDTYTTMPGMQLYTANFLDPRKGKGGADYFRRCAFCLETGLYANAMNCYGFPSPVLRAGQQLHSETTYAFSLIG